MNLCGLPTESVTGKPASGYRKNRGIFPTSQLVAIRVIQVPISEILWPLKNRR